ncbi:MAG: type II toxin-antitoxin system Phd/YefM family antitoxin [Gemmatimonadota bacterium]
MRRVGVAELKKQLSRYMAVARGGEDVLITDRGKPVARLTSVRDRDADTPAHLLEMERRGEVRIGSGRLPDPASTPRPPRPRAGGSAVQAVIDERAEGR